MHVVYKKKKGVSGWWYVLFLVAFTSIAWSSTYKKDKTYKIEMTLKEINTLVYCLNQSNAPAVTTNSIIEIISSQVNPILQQEQKLADSVNKLPPKKN